MIYIDKNWGLELLIKLHNFDFEFSLYNIKEGMKIWTFPK
jgi:hypothetical protein